MLHCGRTLETWPVKEARQVWSEYTCELSGTGKLIATESRLAVNRHAGVAYGELIVK